jgi:hypothetical protein
MLICTREYFSTALNQWQSSVVKDLLDRKRLKKKIFAKEFAVSRMNRETPL